MKNQTSQMERLTENRKKAIIELARRGEGGEMENARQLCEQHGIAWQETETPATGFNRNEYSVRKPVNMDKKKDCAWQSVCYGLALEWAVEHSSLYQNYKLISERFTKQIIAEQAGVLSLYKDKNKGTNILFFGTEVDAKKVQDQIDELLPQLLTKIEKSYSDFIFNSDLHFKGSTAIGVPPLKGDQYTNIHSRQEEII